MTYISTVLALSPVGFWTLGESSGTVATDQAGNQDGVYTHTAGGSGVPTLGQTGIPSGGTAALFTAANKHEVTIADKAAQHVGGTFTLEFWAKRRATGVNDGIINGGVGTSYGLAFNNTNHLELAKTDEQVINDSTSTLTDTSSFHHCVATLTGAAVHLYIDGVDVTGTPSLDPVSNSNGINIGHNSPDARWFDGTLAMVAIYPTALSAGNVLNNYTVGSTAPTSSSTFSFGGVAAAANLIRRKGRL